MKKYLPAVFTVIAVIFMLLSLDCREKSLADRLNKLPELPQEIAAILDTNTLATFILNSFTPPVLDSNVALAPCCGIEIRRSLKVTFSYTKCGPMRNFMDAEEYFGGQGMALSVGKGAEPTRFKAFKLTKLPEKVAFDSNVCLTSEGPWHATLIESRPCVGYTPHYTLSIIAFGDLITFYWNGDIQNHPPEVGLVSCHYDYTLKFFCKIPSLCDCSSIICPQTDPCDCGEILW